MADRYAGLQARTQRALIEFLSVDLDLALTFLQTAKIEADSDFAHCAAAFNKARIALVSIRHFQGRIQDPAEWQKIHDRANELQAALNAFAKRFST